MTSAVDRVVHHDPVDIWVFICLGVSDCTYRASEAIHLENGLFDINPDALSILAFPRIAHQPQLEVDANLLACFFSELAVSAFGPAERTPCRLELKGSGAADCKNLRRTSAYVLASSLSVARIPTKCVARPANRADEISFNNSVLNGTWTFDAVICTPCGNGESDMLRIGDVLGYQ